MTSIRKFVGYTGAAAGITAAIAIAMASQAVVAAAPTSRASDQPARMQAAPSAECSAAIQAIKTAAINDSAEDASERALAKTNPGDGTDVDDDAAELANFKSLFSAARTACAPAAETAPKLTTFTPSAACTAALQALKAAWVQGRPTTQAQWINLQSLAQAVRAACGWEAGRR
ncbi:MAG: hypothetical protein E6J06_01225 [Chloroflexi bacterium]|nr:MAG: hypothetical protein E6J06_01225 [Chloroflexota bacterium]